MESSDMWKLGELASLTGGLLVSGEPEGTASGVSTDTRTLRRGAVFFAIRGERHDGHEFLAEAARRGASGAFVDKKRPAGIRAPDGLPLIKVADTVAALGRLAAEVRSRTGARVLAVTGSAGKTTTKEMLAAVLRSRFRVHAAPSSFNNAIGVPLSILSAPEGAGILVLEAGASHLGEMERLGRIIRPDVAVVTNVGPAHLEGFGTEEQAAREKSRLLAHVAPGGTAVLPADSPYLDILLEAAPPKRRTFGLGPGAEFRAGSVERSACGRIRLKVRMRTREDMKSTRAAREEGIEVRLNFPGRSAALNALSALCAAEICGISPAEAAPALAELAPPPMRLCLRRGKHLSVLDDTYNANPLSYADAIEAWSSIRCRRRWAVAGTMRELGEKAPVFHEELGRRLALSGAELVLAVGEHAESIARAALSAGMAERAVAAAPSAEEADRKACALARPGDLVLVKGSRALGLERVAEAILARSF